MSGIRRRASGRRSREAEISKRGQRTERLLRRRCGKSKTHTFFRGVRDGTFDRCFVENVSSEIQLSVKAVCGGLDL